jgi:hypothetical protein
MAEHLRRRHSSHIHLRTRIDIGNFSTQVVSFGQHRQEAKTESAFSLFIFFMYSAISYFALWVDDGMVLYISALAFCRAVPGVLASDLKACEGQEQPSNPHTLFV